MLEKFLSLLERIAVALETAASPADAPAQAAPSRRGRPARGEANGVALTPEQLAANAAAAQNATAAAATAGAAAQTATVPADKPVETVPTLQQVADAIIDLANHYSRDAAVKILTDAGVKKVPELKKEQYAAVLEAVKKAKQPAASSDLV